MEHHCPLWYNLQAVLASLLVRRGLRGGEIDGCCSGTVDICSPSAECVVCRLCSVEVAPGHGEPMDGDQQALCSFELSVGWLDDNALHAILRRGEVTKDMFCVSWQCSLTIGLGAHKEIDFVLVED